MIKATKSGRLKACLARNAKGRLVIRDEALARQEWFANTSRSAKATGVDTSRRRLVTSNRNTPVSLVDAQRQLQVERRRKLKLENDVAEGRLVPVNVVVRENFESSRIIRESLQNLPARLAGELAAETDAMRMQLALETGIREALTAVADRLVRTPGAEEAEPSPIPEPPARTLAGRWSKP